MKKHRIEFRVGSLDKAIIEKKAKKAGLSISEFCRRSVLDQKVDYKLTSEELQIYQELHEFRRNFVLISNMFKVKDPLLAEQVRSTAAKIENHLKKFQ